jgi:hypothetical protein
MSFLRSMMSALAVDNEGASSALLSDWCVDSGATAHMCASSAELSNYSKLATPMSVVFAGDTVGEIVGVGTHFVPTQTGSFKMTDVLHVPSLVENLLSLAECWRQKIGVNFDPDNDIVTFVQNGTLVMTASFRNGLFYLDTAHHARAAAAVGAPAYLDAHHWHQKLGHVSFSMLARMQRAHLLPPACVVTPEEFLQARHVACEACLKGKHTRGGRPAATAHAPRTCYILHADVLVLPEPDVDGHRYALCVVDGRTAKSVTCLMKLKSDAKHILPDILAMFERQSGQLVLRLRTDRGGEFLNEILDSFLKSKGILHEKTAGYSSESNGVAER